MKPSVVIVIPARAGSKGIPGKNIRPLLGKPLLTWTIEAARQAGLGEHLYVSTDGAEIARVATEAGAGVIMRPPEIAHDTASTEAALMHVIETLRHEGKIFDMILTLPPTSPLRSAGTIRRFLDHFIEHGVGYDSQLSLNEHRGDFWVRAADGSFSRLYPDAPRRRQERQPLYLENSAMYITRVEALLATSFILGRKAAGFVISEDEALDINESVDLLLAEHLLAARQARHPQP